MESCWVLVTDQLCAADCLSQTTDVSRLLACLPEALLPVWGPGEQVLFKRGLFFVVVFKSRVSIFLLSSSPICQACF